MVPLQCLLPKVVLTASYSAVSSPSSPHHAGGNPFISSPPIPDQVCHKKPCYLFMEQIYLLPKFPSNLQQQTPLEDRPIFRENVGNAIGDAPHPQRLPGFSSDPPNLAGSSVIKKTAIRTLKTFLSYQHYRNKHGFRPV